MDTRIPSPRDARDYEFDALVPYGPAGTKYGRDDRRGDSAAKATAFAMDLAERRKRCERAAARCGNYDKVRGRCREANRFCFEIDDCERWHDVGRL